MREHRSNTRFVGAVTGALHARRASAKDIDRSVRIRMGSVSAIDAVKDRLALAALSVHGPAFRTGLRGIGGVHIFDAPAPLGELDPGFCGNDPKAIRGLHP